MPASDEVTMVVPRRQSGSMSKFMAFLGGVAMAMVLVGIASVAYRKGEKDALNDLNNTRCQLARQYQVFTEVARSIGEQTVILTDAVIELQKTVEDLDSYIVAVHSSRRPRPLVKDFRTLKLPDTLNDVTKGVCP